MSSFLIRDESKTEGYTNRQGDLPRIRGGESYMPWALTNDNRVVYANFNDPVYDWRTKPVKAGLRPYTAIEGQNRRRLCQSDLGMIALDNLYLSALGVQKVSTGIQKFLEDAAISNKQIIEDYHLNVGKYAYGLTYMSFGRFSDRKLQPNQTGRRVAWGDAMSALSAGKPLAGLLNIHDNVPRKLLKKYGSKALKDEYEKWAEIFRAENQGELFYDNSKYLVKKTGKDIVPGRGRRKRGKEEYKPSDEGGILPTGAPSIGKVQLHNRGVDMFARSAPHYKESDVLDAVRDGVVRTKFSATSYWRDLDTRRELFGAGPSGTTGTLLASAMTFGNLHGEELRQYCMAIIGYLVGGGCHSLHESLTVMGFHPELKYHSSSLLGYKSLGTKKLYADSSSFPIFPSIFLRSQLFKVWRDKYYDIVVLGGTHWMLGSN